MSRDLLFRMISYRLFLKDFVIIGITAIVVLAIAYKLVNENFSYIYLTTLLCSLIAAILISTNWLKNSFVLLTAIFFSLMVGELVLRAVATDGDGESGRIRQGYTKGYSEPLRENGGPLGYGPIPNRTVRAWKIVGTESVYDATYGISPEGVRITPVGDIQSYGDQTFVFYGGSFAFGEGLNDDQTLPYFFSRELEIEHSVVNLAFLGYGPHQMLRSLELGRFDNLLREPIGVVFYIAVPNHVERSAGNVFWDPFGPRYVLDSSDMVRYVGPFTTIRDVWKKPYYLLLQMFEVARRSVLVDHIANAITASPGQDPADKVRLFGKIVEKSSKLVRDRYDAEFYVLLWDSNILVSKLMKEQLNKANIHTVLVSDYIPTKDLASFKIPNDVHPNAAANHLLARALSELIKSR